MVDHRFLLLLILGRVFREGNCWGLSEQESFHSSVHIAACALRCHTVLCEEDCRWDESSHDFIELKGLDEDAGANARLICRDEDYLVLRINPGTFIFEVQENRNSSDATMHWLKTFWSSESRIHVRGLQPGRRYRLRISRVSPKGFSRPEMTDWIPTMPKRYQPKSVPEIKMGWHVNQPWPREVTIIWDSHISFTPSEDRCCFYEVTCQQDNANYNKTILLNETEEFSTSCGSLPYGVNVTVSVTALTEQQRHESSTDYRKTITTFSTPRCITRGQTYGTICEPPAVTGLEAEAIHKRGNTFDVYVTWNKVERVGRMINYDVAINPIGAGTGNWISKTVKWQQYTRLVVFSDVKIAERFDVYIKATNEVGDGPEISRRFTILQKLMQRIVAINGLDTTAIHKVGNTFDIHVIWNRPELTPDYYNISITSNTSEVKDFMVFRNVPGLVNETFFSDVEISDEFDVLVKAWFSTGRGSEISKRFKTPQMLPRGNLSRSDNAIPISSSAVPNSAVIGVGVGIVISIGIGTGIAVYWCYRLKKKGLSEVDVYKISPKRLAATRVLGGGAFGIVKLGSLRDDQGHVIDVAVKMLRDDSTEYDLRSFLLEIRMMKELGKHPNIVSLLGCCTIGSDPFLVLEYCSRGDLHSFLRKSLLEATVSVDETNIRTPLSQRFHKREGIHEENSEVPPTFGSSGDYVEVHSFGENQDTSRNAELVTILDMLNFGRQIATGMEFLSLKRIVHRDLAARNILVCDDRTVKISDFGLSRDVYQENIYKKRGIGRMPLKWMAIEALTHQVYSTCSDVWSFGVLLWEIATLGGDPYPGIPTIQILNRLRSGYRMEKPENCSVPLYNVMRSCWQTRPKDRPTFTILRQELDKLICTTAENG